MLKLPEDIIIIIYQYKNSINIHEINQKIIRLYKEEYICDNSRCISGLNYDLWTLNNSTAIKYHPYLKFKFYCNFCGSLQKPIIRNIFFKCPCEKSWVIEYHFAENNSSIFSRFLILFDHFIGFLFKKNILKWKKKRKKNCFKFLN